MTSINIIYRPSVRTGRHQGSLTLRLIHERRIKSITLSGCRLYEDEWDKQKQAVIYPGNNPKRTAYLEQIEQTIFREIALLEEYLLALQKQGRYTTDDILRLYRLRKDDGKLSGYAGNLAYQMQQSGQVRTSRAYLTVTRGIVDFNGGKDIPLAHINARLIKDFETHLKNKGRMPNTISYYMRNLRAIYNKAISDKRITARNGNPFLGVYTGVTQTMKRSLSLDELKKIHNLDLSSLLESEKPGSGEYRRIQKLDTARRLFTFSFYARGMCFIDLAHLRKDNIRSGFIRYVRKKTGRQIEVRVTPEMQQLIDSFAEEVKASPYLFPIICAGNSNKNIRLQYETALHRQNICLKEIASLAKVEKPVSTHWARHSWATIGKLENVPLRVISECLGHSNEKTTLIYLGLLDNSLLDAASDLVASAIMRPGTGISTMFAR